MNKLKSAVKNKQGTTLRLNAIISSSNNFPHELLLTTRQTTRLRNTIEDNLSANIKLSKAPIFKTIQSGGFLGSLLSKVGCPLMKLAVPVAKKVLPPLGSTPAMSAIDAGISNEEMNDIMKIAQDLEDSNILLKEVTTTIKNGIKEQKSGFLSMLLSTLEASLLRNSL